MPMNGQPMMRSPAPKPYGFSLVELMIAMVLGLIVIGAVIALVLSMINSNNQTLRATRLTQELRATLAVVANDLKRARSRIDPLTAATQAAGSQIYNVNTGTAGCIRYAYEGGLGGNWRVIRRDSASNRLIIDADTEQTAATCTSSGQQLGSDQVQITGFTITPTTTTATEPNVRQFDVTITGTLGSGSQGITRTMRQTVFVRSLSGS